MVSNQGNFVPMAGPVRDVFEVLAELVDFTCEHVCNHQVGHDASCVECGHMTLSDGSVICERVTLTKLEEAAVRIADMISKGELA